MARPPAVHQVLATLGYGDAIGHEVLGIRRVLRAAGYESDIFVDTADPRLEHHTRDYWELHEVMRPQDILIHHFSIGSRASRVAYALPGKMVIIYHNITPPQYFLGVHPLLVHLCYLGRRELTAYRTRCSLALGDSEFNRAELEAAGFPNTDVLPVVPSFAHLESTPNTHHRERVRRRVDEHPVRRAGHPEQEDRRSRPLLPRLQDASQSAFAAADRRLAGRIRVVLRDGAGPHREARHARHLLRRSRHERRAHRVLRHRRSVPLRERARRFLRAADRGVLQAHPRAGLRRHRGAVDDGWRRRVVRGQESGARRGADGCDRRRRGHPGSDNRVAGRRARAAAREGLRRHAAEVRRSGDGDAAGRSAAGDVRLLASVRSRRSPRRDPPLPSRGLSRASEIPRAPRPRPQLPPARRPPRLHPRRRLALRRAARSTSDTSVERRNSARPLPARERYG